MRILISGSTGLIGSHLVRHFVDSGDDVYRLVRPETQRVSEPDRVVEWDIRAGTINRRKLSGFDAVINLAGENLSAGPWMDERKRRILKSRTVSTSLLANALAENEQPPRVFISASAVGFYGDRGDETLTDDSAAGDGFLADVCKQWEDAAKPAAQAGIRVVHPRFGMVLSQDGGALAKMLPTFRFGLGGRFGNGTQYMPWIAIEDVVGIVDHIIRTDSLSGAVNVVAPEPATNAEFTEVLGEVLSRPTLTIVPAFALKLMFGDMAREMLLASQRVVPTRLTASGYVFRRPTLQQALEGVR